MAHDLSRLDAELQPQQKAELMAKWAEDARQAAERKERAEKDAQQRTLQKLQKAFTEHAEALQRIEAGAAALYGAMATSVQTGRIVAELLVNHPNRTKVFMASNDQISGWIGQLVNGLEVPSLAERSSRINATFLAEHWAP